MQPRALPAQIQPLWAAADRIESEPRGREADLIDLIRNSVAQWGARKPGYKILLYLQCPLQKRDSATFNLVPGNVAFIRKLHMND